ncbi:helix-turn-helix transcriptional regulator [Crassaminicella thermophila]|uniref:Helix-turn-helix transcriptional regulator n=1 Tax=Crassaminicella thermophila TaxID=2599308 RepID=A0A5C0SJS9_CRATE|nr:helix-turn-helix domain-containing protein [Crassaminicella thermophila]QEK13438.1 helix-turn-helix transcriptional regulator [Crassaminicella thermophila]
MPKSRTNKVSCSNYRCEIEITLELISGKWKALILWNLGKHKVIRFNEFRRIIPEITQKMLTQQLRCLEENGLIHRKVYNQIPPMVEYSLSTEGKKLIPILEQMDSWGKDYVTNYQKQNSIKKGTK